MNLSTTESTERKETDSLTGEAQGKYSQVQNLNLSQWSLCSQWYFLKEAKRSPTEECSLRDGFYSIIHLLILFEPYFSLQSEELYTWKKLLSTHPNGILQSFLKINNGWVANQIYGISPTSSHLLVELPYCWFCCFFSSSSNRFIVPSMQSPSPVEIRNFEAACA